MSIDSQIDEMMTLAKRDKLKIKEVKKESHHSNLPVLAQYLWSFSKKSGYPSKSCQNLFLVNES
jgi:hypothetical protein